MIKPTSAFPIFLLLICCLSHFNKLSANGINTDSISLIHSKIETFQGDKQSDQYASLLFTIGKLYAKQEEYDKAKEYYFKVRKIEKNIHDKQLIIENLHMLGTAYFWQSKYDSTTLYFNTILKDYSSFASSKDSINIFFMLGNAYFYQGDLRQSHRCKFKSLELRLREGGIKNKANSYYSLGEIYIQQKKYKEAINKLEEATQLYKEAGELLALSFCEDLMGYAYHQLGEHEKALDYRIRSCDEKYGITTHYNKAHCKHITAKSYVKLGAYDKALPLFLEALKIRKESGQYEDAVKSGMALSKLYVLQNKCKKGMRLMKNYLEEAKKLGIKPLIRDAYGNMADVAYQCGEYKTAFDFKNLYINIRDSINDDAIRIQVANLDANHELNAKSQKLTVLEKENEVNKLHYSLMLSMGITLLLLVIIGYWLFYKKSVYSKLLEEKNKKIENQVKAISNSNDKLNNVNHELEQFAYIVSHDLKAPLRTIGSYTTLLKRRYSEAFDEDGLQFMKFITDGVNHMQTLLEDVLAYSKLKDQKFQPVAIDVKDLIEQVLFALESTIQSKNAIIIEKLNGEVKGNKTQLFQLFQNLIDNALKFIPDDRQPMLKILVKEEGDFLEFSIEDNGIGIEEKFHEKIFTPFKRLHNHSEYKGTGVGLAICKTIVERHNGKIWLSSDGESGTTFHFTLERSTLPRLAQPSLESTYVPLANG